MREWSLSSSRLDHCRIMSRYLDGAWWNNWIPHSPVYTDQSKAMCNLADSRQNNFCNHKFYSIILQFYNIAKFYFDNLQNVKEMFSKSKCFRFTLCKIYFMTPIELWLYIVILLLFCDDRLATILFFWHWWEEKHLLNNLNNFEIRPWED